ncbi:MAG TPA: DUF3014 domain-containing protein [Luteibacter sp.]|uniref:DUF3014 domain-containing protein n=1 Tax=Luteibacter sp. TaxID=1886636 RepID=UPI002C61E1CD|nr:DUF3014 domain-containing protein [Luteibacter sp.]HVI54225.1 DUF3014 domain-containing protein [Luteibacter sp.]
MSSQSTGSKWVAGLLVVAILVVVGIFVYREKQARDALNAPAFSSSPAASASSTSVRDTPLVQHPIGPASGSTAALPPLDQSDDDVLAGLMALTSDGALKSLLRPEAIVSRMVSTIDALPKQSVGMNVVPLHTPTGRFQVVSDDGNFVASKKNAERYATYMYVADRMNTKAAAAWYKRNYPLFQQAYRDLGTDGYFNDRLIEVIDHLLAAPEPKGNQQLLPEKVGYVYANQGLEQLSVGQKFMIRVGPENEQKLKLKLRALREDVIARDATTSGPEPGGAPGR